MRSTNELIDGRMATLRSTATSGIGGAIAPVDPYADKVIAHFPFTDLTSATNFQSKGIVYGQNFGCITSNTNPFGSGNSLNPNNSPRYLKLSGNNNAWEWGSDDWTIELWFKVTTLNRYHSVIFRHNNAISLFSFYVQILNTNKLDFVFRYNGSYQFFTDTTTLSVDTWYFLKFGKNGSNVEGYLNNSSLFSIAVSGSLQSLSDNNVFLGYYFSSTYSMVGNISDLRITRGVFRDTTIPTARFPF
jgi:hypothetical protein